MADLRAAALPLLEELWRQADQTGIPPLQPMWMAFPGDREAAKQDQQWMLGPDVLVAPVVDQGATTRKVYFPAGCWQRPDTDEINSTAGYATVPATIDELPYYFRCGTHPFTPPVPGAPSPSPGPPPSSATWVERVDDPTGEFSGPAGKGYIGVRQTDTGYELGACNRGSGGAYYRVTLPDPSSSGTQTECP